MAHMVRAICILAVPAGWERNNRTYAALAHLSRQGLAVRSTAVDVAIVARGRHAPVADLGCLAWGGRRGVSDQHAEAGRESRDLLTRSRRRDVVHGDSAIGAETLADELRHSSVRAVAGPEIQDRRPVVGEVLRESAARARRRRREIVRRRVHRCVEGVASDDLMQVR